MAKSLSTDTLTNALKQKLKSSSCYSYTKVTYIDDNGVEQEFDDTQYPININKIATPPRYANVNYTPAAATVNFNVLNKGGIYSPKNTESETNEILKRDRVFKFYDGKALFLQTPNVQWILLGTFLLDEPKWHDKQSPKLSTVSVTGRNAWKKALETKYNIESLALGVTLDQFIKDVADIAGMNYTASSIADLSSFGSRNWSDGYNDEVGIDEIYEDIMMIIGKTYRMWMDDSNVLYVTLRPTSYLADWVFNFKRYLKADQEFVGQKQLQRFTIWTDNQVVSPTVELGSYHFITAKTQTINLSNPSTYRFLKVTTGSANVDGAISVIDMANTTVDVTVTGDTVDLTVYVQGNPFKSTEPRFFGEGVNAVNLLNQKGFRYKEINPLMISNLECDNTAEDFISEYGTPAYNVMVHESFLNPLNEINDQGLLVSEDFFEDSLYEMTEIKYIINSEVSKISIVKLLDTGRKYTDQGDIVWNRELFGDPAWQFDTGIIYDSEYAIGSTRSQILAEKTYITDVGFN